jgi:serine phosphatase RsbU (regulator of sigma subunit)
MNELAATRQALWEREAELAAGVPVTPHENESGHLAARLEAALGAGAQAIQCDSAAVYLLDDATSQLKLRAAWGLPLNKFTEPARPLADQLADLEALLGHAVAFEGRGDMVGSWRSPEPAAAALCVPVSSPTNPLGTLWFFSKHERPFSDEQTNIAEVVAGKIAADLDRAVLMESHIANQEVKQQLSVARRSQENQFPSSPPLVGWNLSGWTEQAGALGGAFYDWRSINDDSLMLMLGDACDGGLDGALAASALRAVLHATDEGQSVDLDKLLRRANRVLRENSTGNWWAGAWLGQLDLAAGNCEFNHAGRPTALWLKRDGWASLAKPTEPLGLAPLPPVEKKPIVLSPGESLLVCNRGVMEASDQRGRPVEEAAIARALLENLQSTPDRKIELVRNWLQEHSRETPRRDRSILVVQRLPR